MSNSSTVATGLRRSIRLRGPLDLALTLGPLGHGPGDTTVRFAANGMWRATRTPEGAATERIAVTGDDLEVEAWGPGAGWLLDAAPALVGADDDDGALGRLLPPGPPGPYLRRLAYHFRGLRVGRTGAVIEALVPAITEQKVTGTEAHRAYAGLLRRYGDPAPGPERVRALGLMVPPDPARLALLPSYELHGLGLERRRADTIRNACSRAGRLEALAGLPSFEACELLRTLPGVGAWTTAEVARAAFGDPDAVSVGDFHLPDLVCWHLAGEERGDDARMLELLEPYTGQRGRVVRLLEATGKRPPRHGPPIAPRDIRAL